MPPTEPCMFCGGPELVELFEVWSDHNFMLKTCCEGMHEAMLYEMQDPSDAKALLRHLQAEEITGHSLRRVAETDGHLILDYNLNIQPITFSAARSFVGDHHVHNRPPAAWRFGMGTWNGDTLIGVVMVGNPVARLFNNRGILEVNRLCIRRDLDRPLVWNACSQLYGWAAREARRRGFRRIITYTREDEHATTLRAAGWTREATIRARSWHTPSRPRPNAPIPTPKVRWSRILAA